MADKLIRRRAFTDAQREGVAAQSQALHQAGPGYAWPVPAGADDRPGGVRRRV